MIYTSVLCALCLWLARGVDADEVKSVSVMEGDSVTLHTHLTHVHTDDLILWQFVNRGTRIAEIHKKSIDMFDSNKTFGDRLKLDSQTGSLSITNIRLRDSGLYKLQISSDRGTSDKRFSVTVYGRLPVPVIISDSSVSRCVLLCSVMNVTRVSLSWYKGKSLLSSISVSDLIIRLSLHLEVEYQDTNTYRCVVNNPIMNHTQHLHITDVCQTCSGWILGNLVVLLFSLVVLALLSLEMFFQYRGKQAAKKGFDPCEHAMESLQPVEEGVAL